AKRIITDALIGIAAAVLAYLFLYLINPDLTRISINFTAVNVDVSTYGGLTGVGNPTPISGNCKSDAMLAKIKKASEGKLDPCLTFALLNTESGCTANAQSGAGACGIAQLLPSTAGVSCTILKSNVDLSIQKGIDYFLSNKSRIRGNLNESGNSVSQAIEDLYAGYNGGAGALKASKTCTTGTNSFGYAYRVWDCPQNSGYKETRIAAPRFLNSYVACKKNESIQNKFK
ncbi:MAG: lytic transglycosylase domain-containing protein, partial [Candidatus Moranbacteria bacterium]|nr:lytic transglycosylase domain-containing protein [Candidatus Moranbacteria bacterium]